MSLRFLPRTMMVSPRKSWSVSMVAGLSWATELSSDVLSSTTRRLGLRTGTRVTVVELIGSNRHRRRESRSEMRESDHGVVSA